MLMAVSYLVLWLGCGFYGSAVYWRADVTGRYVGGTWLVCWILLGMLGWHDFRAALR